MSVAVIASNTSIKVSAAVNGSGTNNGTNDTDTLYTCAANSYAIVQLTFTPGGSAATANFKIDGSIVATAYTTGGGASGFVGQSSDLGSGTVATLTGFYIGPSQVLSVTWVGSSTSAVARVTGVAFINTP